jgi:hypothetical protein
MDKDGDQTNYRPPLWLVKLWLSAKPNMLDASLCRVGAYMELPTRPRPESSHNNIEQPLRPFYDQTINVT